MRLLLIACLLPGCLGPALFVDQVGDGEGIVRSNPSGIECGETCGMLATGPVTLTAMPAVGAEFAGWEGACSGAEQTCTLDVAEDVRVSAHFVRIPHLLEVTPTEGGAVTSMPAGIACGEDCSESFPHGTRVTLLPHPAAGYSFWRWTNLECEGSENCLLDLVEPRKLVAEFIAHQILTVTSDGEGKGIVRSSIPGIDGASGTSAFPYGSVVTLTATAEPGSRFVGWAGECAPAGDTCFATMHGARAVVATFSPDDNAMCTTHVNASESSASFNLRLTFGAKVCLAPGVVISGGVTVPSNAWGVTIRGLPGVPMPRIVNTIGTAVNASGTRDLVLRHLELEASGPSGTSAVRTDSVATTIYDATLRSACSGCSVLSTLGGASVQVLYSRLLAYDGAPSGSTALNVGDSTVDVSDSELSASSTVIFANAGSISVLRSTIESHTPQSGGAINLSNAAFALEQSVVRVLGHDVIQAGMFLGDVAITLNDNELRKAAGATAGTYAPFVMTRGVNHVYSSQPNRFCNEGTSTTDGEFAAPWISGAIASDSTFNSVMHAGPNNCP